VSARERGSDAGLPSEVHVTRGPLVESRHLIHAVVTDANGRVIASVGDPELITYWRSCAKLFQVMPLLSAGDNLPFGWEDDAIALACASHGGEPEHLAVVERMLASLELTEEALACGPSMPLSVRGLACWRASGTALTRLHNNCSGKHAAMLALAVQRGWPTAGYHEPQHPVQREALAQVAAWSGRDAATIPVGVDGCGVSVFGLPLVAMAAAYARLGIASRAAPSVPARVVAAVRAHPLLFAGTDRFDTVLLRETGGRLVAKIGADGVHCVTAPGEGLGVAIKIADGSVRVQHAAVVAVLQSVGLLPDVLPDALEAFGREPVRNTRDQIVGWISASRVLG
jgi:L-asparaginase II